MILKKQETTSGLYAKLQLHLYPGGEDHICKPLSLLCPAIFRRSSVLLVPFYSLGFGYREYPFSPRWEGIVAVRKDLRAETPQVIALSRKVLWNFPPCQREMAYTSTG